MFGPLGFPELIFILVLALLIFGPKRLPEIGRTIGKGMSEFRKASNDLKRTINTELALDEPAAPPVRPWSEPAAPSAMPAMPAMPATPAAPANTAARAPQTAWIPPSEPEILEPEPDDRPQPEPQPAVPASVNEPLEPS